MTASLFSSIQGHFDDIAESYDQVFTDTVIGRVEREAVWQELTKVFHCGQQILELNCGTGVDAAYLAERGVRVVACDVAPRMIEVARRRLSSTAVADLVDFRVLPIEDIGVLLDEGPFDGAFSNFSGLNCVNDLSAAGRDLARLLKPGARVLLCMSGRFVPMEIAWYLAHGSPRKATRRFARSAAARHPTDDPRIHVHYPSARAIARAFAPEFRLLKWKGIGVAIPPAYFESWARRFPSVFDRLIRADRWLGRLRLLRGMAGHFLLQFEREEAHPLQQPAW